MRGCWTSRNTENQMVSLSLLATGILRIVGLALGWFWKGIRGDFKWLSKSIRDCQVEFSRQITSDEWILYQISIWLKNFTFKDGIYIIFSDNIINAFPYKIYYKKRQLHYKAWIYIIIWQLHILFPWPEGFTCDQATYNQDKQYWSNQTPYFRLM